MKKGIAFLYPDGWLELDYFYRVFHDGELEDWRLVYRPECKVVQVEVKIIKELTPSDGKV